MARLIGTNRREAIDWTQDKYELTRPMAEAVVQSMLDDKAALIGDFGVLLFESDDDLDKRNMKSKKSFNMKAMRHVRFHAMRKNNSRHTKAKNIHFDWNNANAAANDMDKHHHHHARSDPKNNPKEDHDNDIIFHYGQKPSKNPLK